MIHFPDGFVFGHHYDECNCDNECTEVVEDFKSMWRFAVLLIFNIVRIKELK